MGWLLTYRVFIGVLLDAGRDLFVISHFVISSFVSFKTSLMSPCSTNDNKLRRDSVIEASHGC